MRLQILGVSRSGEPHHDGFRWLTSSKKLPSAAAARRALASTESLNLPASAASSKGRLSRE